MLTSARGERDSGYLSRPNLLSAYLRYFLPWNVFRLVRLFSFKTELSADAEKQNTLPALLDGDAVTDLGSGPLTLPIALWMAFPHLRTVKLEFRCVDKSSAILDAGRKLFSKLCNGASFWKIKTIHDSIYAPVRGKPAKLVTALNVFNEVFNEIFTGMQSSSIIKGAEKAAALLCKLCADDGSILVVEPGNPQGGAFISTLRTALLKKGKCPVAPCPHTEPCPLPGIGIFPNAGPAQGHSAKAKWCHFAFDTDAAPAALHKLSRAAGIPKERATLSFLLAGAAGVADIKRMHDKADPMPSLHIRIVSDTFSVPFGKSGIGCYGCSEKGMVLVTGNPTQKNELASGTLLNLPLPKTEQRDPKTGALIVPL